jgi:hypothetical protein
MAVHQNGKVCILLPYDAEQLEQCGIIPPCGDHRHLRKATAEEMAHNRLLRRIKLPGPDRFVWIRAQHWRKFRGVMQLVDGDIPGRTGRVKYEIPAAGAHGRRQIVHKINAEDGRTR